MTIENNHIDVKNCDNEIVCSIPCKKGSYVLACDVAKATVEKLNSSSYSLDFYLDGHIMHGSWELTPKDNVKVYWAQYMPCTIM